jgi:uncharacterized protein (DUF697 family)
MSVIIQYVLKNIIFDEFYFQIQKPHKMNHEDKREKADNIITNHVGFAASAGFLPFPGADIAAVTAVQLNMLRQLSSLYRTGFMDSIGKNVISAIVGSSVSRLAASLVKLIPGVGTTIGSIAMPVLSGSSTYALGQVVASHFAKGGTLENFDFGLANSKYKEELKKGKEVVKETATQAATIQDDVVAKLKKLSELKDAGILTDEEFTQMKTKLLAQL